jgi:hypothetical protein
VDPGPCGYAGADVGFDRARTYAVDDDERSSEVLASGTFVPAVRKRRCDESGLKAMFYLTLHPDL